MMFTRPGELGPPVTCIKCGAPVLVNQGVRFQTQFYCGWPCFELDVDQAVDEVFKNVVEPQSRGTE